MNHQENQQTTLDKQIRDAQKSLIPLRYTLISMRQCEAFLEMAQISSPLLRKEVEKKDFLIRFLYDSAEDGTFAVYFFDLQMGEEKHCENLHTDPSLDKQWKLAEQVMSDSWWETTFLPFVVGGENKQEPLLTLFHLLTETKDVDDATWKRIQFHLKPHVLKNPQTQRAFLGKMCFTRFVYLTMQHIERQDQFPGRMFPCECVTHYVANESLWVFPCLGRVTV
jgi:hypothetical protein